MLASLVASLLWATPLRAADASTDLRNLEQLFQQGGAVAALPQLEQALRAQPDDAGLRFLQAVVLAEAGRQAEAAQVLERLTQSFPDLPEPYNNLAVLRAADGQLALARSLLETALRLDPLYRTAHVNLGDVLVSLASQAYQTAAGLRDDAALRTKLRLARDLAALR